MIGNGIGFILHENGYSCSNQVDMSDEIERVDDGGQKKSKHTIKLKFNCIFDGVGKLAENLVVYCLYKDDEKGVQKAFAGEVTKVNDKFVIITTRATSDNRIEEIKQKIKSWQHKQTS